MSISQASGTGNTPVTVKFGSEVVKSYSVNNYTKDGDLRVTIEGSLTSLTVNTKVTSVELNNAYQLTSLVFSSTAGSTINSFAFAGTGQNKLKTLTVNNCGLTYFPGMMGSYLAEGANVSFQNNEITKIPEDNIVKDKKINYNFSGNKIYKWPDLGENATSKITYGTQSLSIDLGTVKANEWFDFYSALNNEISNYLGTGANSIAVSDLTVTWNSHTFETEKVTEGYDKTPRLSFRFWEGGKYVDGTFIAKAVIKNGPTYDNIKLIVNEATMPLTIIESEGGKLNATYTNGTAIASSEEIEEGKNIVLNPAPEKGYAFDKFEVKGLDVVDAEKHIYKVNIERDAKGFDVLSAKALFKAGTYTVTVKATGTDNGSFKIINLSNSNEEFTSTKNVSYGDKLKVVAKAAPGYLPRWK